MNILFAILIICVPIALLAVAGHTLNVRLMSKIMGPTVTEAEYDSYRKVSKIGFSSLAIFLLAWNVFSAVQTFGPRVTLDTPNQSYTPERSQVESDEEFTDTPEWRGKFDQRINQEPSAD